MWCAQCLNIWPYTAPSWTLEVLEELSKLNASWLSMKTDVKWHMKIKDYFRCYGTKKKSVKRSTVLFYKIQAGNNLTDHSVTGSNRRIICFNHMINPFLSFHCTMNPPTEQCFSVWIMNLNWLLTIIQLWPWLSYNKWPEMIRLLAQLSYCKIDDNYLTFIKWGPLYDFSISLIFP